MQKRYDERARRWINEDTKAKFIKSEADTENQESVTNEEKTSTNESEDIKETQEMQDSQELWVFRYMKKEHKVPIYKYEQYQYKYYRLNSPNIVVWFEFKQQSLCLQCNCNVIFPFQRNDT